MGVITMQLTPLLLAFLAIPALCSKPPATDEECFTSHYNSSVKRAEDTFQVRVKHGLGIGELYTLEKNKVVEVAATSLAVNTVCVLLKICAGIEEMNIVIITTDNIPQPVPTKCNYNCINADLDAPDIEFSFLPVVCQRGQQVTELHRHPHSQSRVWQ